MAAPLEQMVPQRGKLDDAMSSKQLDELFDTMSIEVPYNYRPLGKVFQAAIDQAAHGKGAERHAAKDELFTRQKILEITRRVGLGYPLGQAVKKSYEAQRLGGDAGKRDLLGAMNYLAAMYIAMDEGVQ